MGGPGQAVASGWAASRADKDGGNCAGSHGSIHCASTALAAATPTLVTNQKRQAASATKQRTAHAMPLPTSTSPPLRAAGTRHHEQQEQQQEQQQGQGQQWEEKGQKGQKKGQQWEEGQQQAQPRAHLEPKGPSQRQPEHREAKTAAVDARDAGQRTLEETLEETPRKGARRAPAASNLSRDGAQQQPRDEMKTVQAAPPTPPAPTWAGWLENAVVRVVTMVLAFVVRRTVNKALATVRRIEWYAGLALRVLPYLIPLVLGALGFLAATGRVFVAAVLGALVAAAAVAQRILRPFLQPQAPIPDAPTPRTTVDQ